MTLLKELEEEGVISLHHGEVPPRLKGMLLLARADFLMGPWNAVQIAAWHLHDTIISWLVLTGLCGWTVHEDKMDEWKRRRQV